jgi:toxin ParE1/3/4
VQEIHDYIAEDSLTAASRWIDRLDQDCQRLAEMPGMGRLRAEFGSGVRSFPTAAYVIFYRETANGIEVLRVLHGARDIQSLF